jgi:hypothetical protein
VIEGGIRLGNAKLEIDGYQQLAIGAWARDDYPSQQMLLEW